MTNTITLMQLAAMCKKHYESAGECMGCRNVVACENAEDILSTVKPSDYPDILKDGALLSEVGVAREYF